MRWPRGFLRMRTQRHGLLSGYAGQSLFCRRLCLQGRCISGRGQHGVLPQMRVRVLTVQEAIYLLLNLLLQTSGSALAQSPSVHAYAPPEVRFPADAGVINVKTQFGAKGDGLSDDTAAIRAAIEGRMQVRVLYFPKCKYVVSGGLNWLGAD